MTKGDYFLLGLAVGALWAIVDMHYFNRPKPTPKQCETILNQNPEMCLSVCVDEFEKFGC